MTMPASRELVDSVVRLVCLSAVVGVVGGCAALMGPGGPQGLPHRANFSHDEAYCLDPVRGGYIRPSNRLSTQQSLSDNVRNLMCHDDTDGAFYARLYRQNEYQRFSHMAAAFMILDCVAEGRCDADGRRFSYGITASLYPYVRWVDAGRVAQELAQADAPPEVKTAFLSRLEAARAHMTRAVQTMNPRMRAVFVDTVERVVSQRLQDEQALAELYRAYEVLGPQLDAALLDHQVSEGLRAQALELRDHYVRACQGRGRSVLYCLSGPIGRPLTERILRMSLQLEDGPMAHAERMVLRAGPDQSDLRYEVHQAAALSMRKETADHRRHSEALRQGIDAALLAQRFGDPPPENLYDYSNAVGLRPPQVSHRDSTLSGMRVERILRPVRRVRTRRGKTTIHFEDTVHRSGRQTGCVETNRVDTITNGGEVIYRLRCTGPWVTHVSRNRVEPVTVPAAEALSIVPGQVVMAFADPETRDGAIVQVAASAEDETVLQLRSYAAADPVPE